MEKKFNEEIIKEQANKLWGEYKNGKAPKWKIENTNTYEKCLKFAYQQAEVGAIKNAIIGEKSKKKEFCFDSENLRKKYQTYRNYLAARCGSIPSQLEKKFKNCYAWHKASGCYGMSNYIEISNEDSSITIRISDHNQTSSGSPCDYYIYIQDKTWMEIKKEVFEIAENFLK